MKKTPQDFWLMSWEEYQEIVNKITCELKQLQIEKDVCFKYIVPILRGGGVLAISLSHSLNVPQLLPIQYKYEFSINKNNNTRQYLPIEKLSCFDLVQCEENVDILVTEGNHCTGETAQKCIDKTKRYFPNCKIYYASVGRDYSFLNHMNNTEYETYGILTNESEALTQDKCNNLGIINKFCVYPWENVIEEMNEVNNHLV